MLHDSQLLRQFVEEHSQAAFRQIVERHTAWLYSVCLRRLGDSALAEDATQAVFLALAQRAPFLLRQQTISPWLHQAARFCATNLLRSRIRRQRYESEAAVIKSSELASPPSAHWQNIEADFEPALDRLGARDRNLILLRFYEQKNHPEIAAVLGISQEASQKRLSRALQRLRNMLVKRRGADTAGLSALALGDLLARHTVGQAPKTLLTSLLASGSSGPAHLAPMAGKILFSFNLAAMKFAAIAAILVLAVIPLGILLTRVSAATPLLAQASGPLPAQAVAPSTEPASDDSIIRIPNLLLRNTCRGNEYAVGLDPDTKRTGDSPPAGCMKSLLPKFNPNDQANAARSFAGPYPVLRGKRVRLSAWLKTRNVDGWCGLRMVIIRNDIIVAADDMRDRPVHGTTDWAQYQVVMDVPGDATRIFFAAAMFGKGEVWTDDFQLQPVGQDVPVTGDEFWQKYSYFAANYTAEPDPQTQHDGHASICISSTPQAKTAQWISYNHDELNTAHYRGKFIHVTIWMKSSRISGQTGIAINVFGPSGRISTEGQRGHRPLIGTHDWQQYTADAYIPPEADEIGWGIVMNGTGKLWIDADSAQCDIRDAPANDAPANGL